MGAVENPTATVGFVFTGVAKAKHQNTQPPVCSVVDAKISGPTHDATEPTTAAATATATSWPTPPRPAAVAAPEGEGCHPHPMRGRA